MIHNRLWAHLLSADKTVLAYTWFAQAANQFNKIYKVRKKGSGKVTKQSSQHLFLSILCFLARLLSLSVFTRLQWHEIVICLSHHTFRRVTKTKDNKKLFYLSQINKMQVIQILKTSIHISCQKLISYHPWTTTVNMIEI